MPINSTTSHLYAYLSAMAYRRADTEFSLNIESYNFGQGTRLVNAFSFF